MGLVEVKTVKITGKGQISIPKEVREIEGFTEGSKVILLVYDDHVEIRNLKSAKETLDLSKEGIVTALLSEKSLAKLWNSKEEDEAWKHL